MRYRYTRAFIAEGTLARESQEIVLFDEPGEGMRFVLSSAPDSYLTDADKIVAAGVTVLSRITVAGAPPPPPSKPLGVIVDEIRAEREKLLNQRMVLVCQFDGTADPLKIHVRSEVEGDTFSTFNRSEIEKITGKHEKAIERAITSLFAADALIVRFEALAESFRFADSDGLEILAVAFGGYVSSVRRTGIDREMEVKLKTQFQRCFRSDKNLNTVTRLLSDSLLAKEDKLRSFLAAWTSLEIFVSKFSTQPSSLPDEKPTSLKLPVLVFRFNSAARNLGLDDPAEKEIAFINIKRVRDDFVHGKNVDDSSFPIEGTQALVRAFLEKIQ